MEVIYLRTSGLPIIKDLNVIGKDFSTLSISWVMLFPRIENDNFTFIIPIITGWRFFKFGSHFHHVAIRDIFHQFQITRMNMTMWFIYKFREFVFTVGYNSWWHMKCAQHAAHSPKFEKIGLFRDPWWWHLKKFTHCSLVTPYGEI